MKHFPSGPVTYLFTMPKERKAKILHPNSRKAKRMIRDQIHRDNKVQHRIDAKHERSAEYEIVKFIHSQVKDGTAPVYSNKEGFFHFICIIQIICFPPILG